MNTYLKILLQTVDTLNVVIHIIKALISNGNVVEMTAYLAGLINSFVEPPTSDDGLGFLMSLL